MEIVSKDAMGSPSERAWIGEAADKIAADFNRSADTHLIKLELPGFEGIDLYLKDELTHPSGSLKHRLARSLFLYGLCNGRIRKGHADYRSLVREHGYLGSLFRALARVAFRGCRA